MFIKSVNMYNQGNTHKCFKRHLPLTRHNNVMLYSCIASYDVYIKLVIFVASQYEYWLHVSLETTSYIETYSLMCNESNTSRIIFNWTKFYSKILNQWKHSSSCRLKTWLEKKNKFGLILFDLGIYKNNRYLNISSYSKFNLLSGVRDLEFQSKTSNISSVSIIFVLFCFVFWFFELEFEYFVFIVCDWWMGFQFHLVISQTVSFSFCVHLYHLMNVRHGILNFNCYNGTAAVATIAITIAAVVVTACMFVRSFISNSVYVQNTRMWTTFEMPTQKKKHRKNATGIVLVSIQ